MEDVKVREMQIFDYKKKIAEAETKLKQQQNLYEAVRSDRNLYSKNLIESQVCNNAIWGKIRTFSTFTCTMTRLSHLFRNIASLF